MIASSGRHYAATQMTWAATAILLVTSMFIATKAQSQGLPPIAKNLKPSETALILVDFQYPFTNPAGDNYRAVKSELEGKQMLDRTVDLVKKARAMGVWVVHVTEGYSKDYRESTRQIRWIPPRANLEAGLESRLAGSRLLPTASARPRRQGSGPSTAHSDFRVWRHWPRLILRIARDQNIAVAGFTTDVCDYATVSSSGLRSRLPRLRVEELVVCYRSDQSEAVLKNTYPMWSKVLGNDEFVAMLTTDSEVTTR